jgi:phage terminase large subunit-like protein
VEAETLILSEKQKLEREAMEIGVKCFNSFYFFFKTFWPEMSGETYIDARHIQYICDSLQFWAMKVIRGEKIMKTIVINVPPGSSKSTIATIALPMWVWLHKPSASTANISYSATLSSQHAYKARAITESTKWHILFDNIFRLKYGKELQIVKQNQNEVLNNFKGNRFNTSVGGTILGMHADIFIKDDLVSAEQAQSDVEREKANRWNDETTSSRRKNPSCYLDIYISQRLHENDICGHVLNKNLDIFHICLPAQLTGTNFVSPEDALSLYTDGILDPNRRPLDVLMVLKEEMGASGYTGQYLQMPFSLEEQAIRPSMFQVVDARDDMTFDLYIDGAYTENKKNDPTGLTVFGFKDHTLYVKQAYNVWKTLPDLLKFIKELGEARIFDPEKGRIFIEPKASGYSLAQYIESETDYNYVLIGLNSDKEEKNIVSQGKTTRHNMIQPKAESGRIKLFKGNWNDDYLTQVCGFPKAAHDEQVDNTGYAVNHYFFAQNMFIEDWAIRKLEKVVPGSIDVTVTSQITKNKFSADYAESSKGDVQLFEDPNKLYHYRYICVAVLRSEGDRGGKTIIQVFDRLSMQIVAYYESDDITPQKTGKKAIEMASLFDNAKLAIAVHKEIGNAQSEENDLSHIALAEVRKVHYENIYSRLTQNDIKLKREREYGFEVNRSTTREVYYNLKEKLETNNIPAVPLEVLSEIKLLERKKETGEVNAREGYQANSVLNYSIALKIHEEMYDKPKVKKSDRWIN